jgi:hypothetical protein
VIVLEINWAEYHKEPANSQQGKSCIIDKPRRDKKAIVQKFDLFKSNEHSIILNK